MLSLSSFPESPAPYQSLSLRRSELMGLATLWVMLFHAYPFSFRIAPLDTFKGLGYLGVDVFILLSAMGIYVSLRRADQRGEGDRPGRFYAKRLMRILPSFWLVVGAYSLFLVQAGRAGWSLLFWNLSTLYFWFQVPGAFNWYIPALLAFYLISPFYVKLFRRCPDAWKAALTAASFPVSYALYRLVLPFGQLYFLACRLPAFALGVLMGHYLVSRQPLTRRHAAAWAGLSLAGLLMLIPHMVPSAGWFRLSLNYLFAAQLVPLCMLLALASGKLPGWMQAFLRLLGRCSLEIYLLNVVVTREFDLLAPYLDRGPGHVFYYAVVYSANLLLGIGLHTLLSRLIPAGPKSPAPYQSRRDGVS